MSSQSKNETAAHPADRLGRKQIIRVILIISFIFLALGAVFVVLFQSLVNRDPGASAPLEAVTQYRYEYAEASNGMKLHALVTKPAYVSLETVNDNVALTDKVGVNGGFFYEGSLVSMGVVNGHPVNGDGYGGGGENMKYARGTLVWDGEADSLSVQVVSKASELKVKDHTRFWAQGGISMSIGRDDAWVRQAEAEHAPFPDEDRLRTGAVFDDRGSLYLVVSENEGTLADFRSAVLETFGDGRLVDGIFLDGDGSSQLSSKEMMLRGDNRPVVQMVRIMK
ncbi:hypothetical protein [Paenibacillus soyae]|uniref:Phosphodiester glycosidase domain-containing protein n=1 Tax=Paenibacillus soyae TaxID=2969249 RepID=A0A9X2MTE4_9BACL|nr:hypothetical protein [Paenibacillus soyae]MCR2805533.1 hypothetical protein [Paenibacillus soyae]